MHALANGDPAVAVGLNVLTVVGLVVLGVIWGRWAVRSWRGRPRSSVAPAWTLYLMLGVAAVFWVVRNLPVGEALAP